MNLVNIPPLQIAIFSQIYKRYFKCLNDPGPRKRRVISCLEQKEGKFNDIESSRTRLSRHGLLECLDFGI